ncbi:MAG: hypothetical protein H6740_21615 [Alphaproteobacteria bacterium]|nr:hypothetical protein [Alphaproteobacteria bacterium]
MEDSPFRQPAHAAAYLHQNVYNADADEVPREVYDGGVNVEEAERRRRTFVNATAVAAKVSAQGRLLDARGPGPHQTQLDQLNAAALIRNAQLATAYRAIVREVKYLEDKRALLDRVQAKLEQAGSSPEQRRRLTEVERRRTALEGFYRARPVAALVQAYADDPKWKRNERALQGLGEVELNGLAQWKRNADEGQGLGEVELNGLAQAAGEAPPSAKKRKL